MALSPSLSVVIPCYNRASLVGATLRSLFHQSWPADEIVLVDDGSTDATVEAAEAEFSIYSREFSGKSKLPQFKVVRQSNAGPGAARNRGLAESRGEFIHFFDSDDIAASNKQEVQLRALCQEGADIAYGPWIKGRINGTGRFSGDGGYESGGVSQTFKPVGSVFQQKGLPKGDLVKVLLTRWSIVPQACMFRRSILEKAGGFPEDMYVAEDQLVFLRCLLAGARVVHTPETIMFYRLGDAAKLTEAPESGASRVVDWLKFLERAENECLGKGVCPQEWFDFRMRLWKARKNVTALSGHAGASCSGFEQSLFAVVSQLRRWWGGLKYRVVGHRQYMSFRCGRVNPRQTALFPAA